MQPPPYFGLRLIVGSFLFGGMVSLVRYLLAGHASWLAFLTIAGAGLLAGSLSFFSSQIEAALYRMLSMIARLVEAAITILLLGIFYYLVLFPASLALKLFGHRAIRKGFDPSAATYWEDAPPPDKAERYFRQF